MQISYFNALILPLVLHRLRQLCIHKSSWFVKLDKEIFLFRSNFPSDDGNLRIYGKCFLNHAEADLIPSLPAVMTGFRKSRCPELPSRMHVGISDYAKTYRSMQASDSKFVNDGSSSNA